MMSTRFTLVSSFVVFFVLHHHFVVRCDHPPKVPCFFIFGDSLSDSGNNNLISSLAKADFLPYGIDFPGGPTGRFTNGRTTVDLISEHLGLEYIPPLWSADGEKVLKGVNYASGSSGILNETGTGVGARIPIDEQLGHHQTVIQRISTLLGHNEAKVKDHLSQCLYSVYAGSNDYMLNYFMTNTALSMVGLNKPGALDKFTISLVTRYTQQLKTLYEYGARKVVIFGLGPLGCLPMLNQLGGCSEPINSALIHFNQNISTLVKQFNSKLSDAKFIFVDTMKIFSPNLSALGLKVTNIPCCGVGEMFFCLPQAVPCSDRNDYAYWDNAHPTEAANKVLARRAYIAENPGDVYPVDISHLVVSDHESKGGDHTSDTSQEGYPTADTGHGGDYSSSGDSQRSMVAERITGNGKWMLFVFIIIII